MSGAVSGAGRRLPDGIVYGAAMVLLYVVARRDVGLIEGLKELFAGLLLIGTVVAVAWVAWHLWNRPATPTAMQLTRRFEAVHRMDGAQFEVFVADLFRAMGHQAVECGWGIRASTSS